jgi:hypothetical protein
MGKYLRFVVVGSALAALAVPSIASADVQRYQSETATLSVTMPQFGWVHTYQITVDPCTNDGSFTGNGSSYQPTEGGWTDESIRGTLSGDHVTFKATYLPDSNILPGYQWSVTNGSLDGVTQTNLWDGIYPTPTTSTLTNVKFFKNHGEYVSQGGDPHSCIGMPINSSN